MFCIWNYVFILFCWIFGFKLCFVFFSDIYMMKCWMDFDCVVSICDIVNGFGGDMILLFGDYVNVMDELGVLLVNDDIVVCFMRFLVLFGMYVIFGNYDYWYFWNFIKDLWLMLKIGYVFEKVGILLLINDVIWYEKDGKFFWFVGFGDQLVFYFQYLLGCEDDGGVDDFLVMFVKVMDDVLVILMVYELDVFFDVLDCVLFMLFGYMYGGQVNIFGWLSVMNLCFGICFRGGYIVENGWYFVVL